MNEIPDRTIIGPFVQIITMNGLPLKGHILDDDIQIIPNAGIATKNGIIETIGPYEDIKKLEGHHHTLSYPAIAVPGFIDSHTHICYAGTRVDEYALRLSGYTYEDISARGGGILNTVKATRQASQDELTHLMIPRIKHLLSLGITTCEVKSGYGLTLKDEIKMLKAIRDASQLQPVTLIPTFLGAHTKPPEFITEEDYLHFLQQAVLPVVKNEKLSHRVDIFLDKHAFSTDSAKEFLLAAKKMGFSLIIHADQLSHGGSRIAAEVKAISADHLEQSSQEDFVALGHANVFPIVLPGASLGLGMHFAQAHLMLDSGLPLVIASDWNPGSAPMGNLIAQASLLAIAEKINTTETLAAITTRAANALELYDRGILANGKRADITIYPTKDYRNILYYQGALTPSEVFIKGQQVYAKHTTA
jgi:imidazolonepropionase